MAKWQELISAENKIIGNLCAIFKCFTSRYLSRHDNASLLLGAALRDNTNDGCVINKCASEDSRNNEASDEGGKTRNGCKRGRTC